MKVTIGGMPGAGKSTIAELAAKKLGMKFYSMGNIMRELASKRGLTISEYIVLKEDIDSEIDNYQKRLGEREDNFIIDGRLSFYFIPDSFKIFFKCNPKVAAKRIFENQRISSEKYYSTVNEAFEASKIRFESDKKRYISKYGVDAFDPKNFDCIVDTTKFELEKAADKVVEIIQKHYKSSNKAKKDGRKANQR